MKNYRLIAADLSKQETLDSDLRAIQRIIFTGTIKAIRNNTRVIINYILEQSKKNARILQRNNKSVATSYKWLNTVK